LPERPDLVRVKVLPGVVLGEPNSLQYLRARSELDATIGHVGMSHFIRETHTQIRDLDALAPLYEHDLGKDKLQRESQSSTPKPTGPE
jgi:hypothetical protein